MVLFLPIESATGAATREPMSVPTDNRPTIRPDRTLMKKNSPLTASNSPKRCRKSSISKKPDICPVSKPKSRPPKETNRVITADAIVILGTFVSIASSTRFSVVAGACLDKDLALECSASRIDLSRFEDIFEPVKVCKQGWRDQRVFAEVKEIWGPEAD